MFYNNATLSLSVFFYSEGGPRWKLAHFGGFKFVAGLTPLGARMSASPSLVQPQ